MALQDKVNPYKGRIEESKGRKFKESGRVEKMKKRKEEDGKKET